MRTIYAAGLLILLVAIGIFCVQNLETVSLSYLGWQINLPLPLLVILIYLAGMLSGWGLLSFLRKSLRGATESGD